MGLWWANTPCGSHAKGCKQTYFDLYHFRMLLRSYFFLPYLLYSSSAGPIHLTLSFSFLSSVNYLPSLQLFILKCLTVSLLIYSSPFILSIVVNPLSSLPFLVSHFCWPRMLASCLPRTSLCVLYWFVPTNFLILILSLLTPPKLTQRPPPYQKTLHGDMVNHLYLYVWV